MEIFGIIAWGYKPGRTYLVAAGYSEKECIDKMREDIAAAMWENEEVVTLEEAEEKCKDDELVKDWLVQNDYILDRIKVGE